MKIYLKTFFTVLSGGRPAEKILDIPEGATAESLLNSLGIKENVELMILINERPSNEKTPLSDGDKVTLMPPVSAA